MVEVVLVRKERTLYGTVVAMVETVYQVLSLEVHYSVQEAEVQAVTILLADMAMVVQEVVVGEETIAPQWELVRQQILAVAVAERIGGLAVQELLLFATLHQEQLFHLQV